MSQATALVPSPVARRVLTNWFTCSVAPATVAGPISPTTSRRPRSAGSRKGRQRNPSRRSAHHCAAICPAPPASTAAATAVIGSGPPSGIRGTTKRVLAMRQTL